MFPHFKFFKFLRSLRIAEAAEKLPPSTDGENPRKLQADCANHPTAPPDPLAVDWTKRVITVKQRKLID